ncbi:MAG: TfuA-like protein, partial [Polymorphobacter sp.]
MTGLPPIVFAGPSLNGVKPEGFELCPPAAAGDLLRLIAGPPRTVALIDGVFDGAAPVQHKEILELLSRGFAVIGGASMGALRAAELHPFGMQGAGAIFAAYAAGRLVADDEVAV